jgi:UDP:flavonoid glycosyltransferase YjiC (YdhE family)
VAVSLQDVEAASPRERVLFVAPGIAGHAMPLVRLAREMAFRGYTVCFITHDVFKEPALSVGGQVRPSVL